MGYFYKKLCIRFRIYNLCGLSYRVIVCYDSRHSLNMKQITCMTFVWLSYRVIVCYDSRHSLNMKQITLYDFCMVVLQDYCLIWFGPFSEHETNNPV